MSGIEQKGIQVRATDEGYGQAQVFMEDLLEHSSVSSQIASETMVVFEALFSLIRMQGFDESTTIDLSGENVLGDLSLKLGFEGKRFNPSYDGGDGASPEMLIVEGFAEKISHSYHHGYNVMRISVRSTPRAFLISCSVGFLFAIAAYLVIRLFLDDNARSILLDGYLFPIETLFGNALLMVGPPVTLLSLLKNVSDVFIASERSADSRRLWAKSIVTSCFAITLSFVTCLVLSRVVSGWRGLYAEYATEVVDHSFAGIVISSVPSNIFEPFETISPVPLVLLAAIVTYALCHASTYFDKLKIAINASYELFSWMLRAVMVVLPFFCFVAILDALLDIGFAVLLNIVRMVLAIGLGVLVLLASYAIRLRLRGVGVVAFTKRILPLLRENLAIGSVIDAVPYNIRFCARNLGMSRKNLSSKLPILAQLSLDGNCFLLMFISMICVYMVGSAIHWTSVLAIAALVLFLEFGAPNQPGGILVGTLIIITYLNLPDMLRMAIYLEVLLGSIQNMINVVSNIVSMVEDEGAILA